MVGAWLLAVLAWSQPAVGEELYEVSVRSEPYRPLDGATVVGSAGAARLQGSFDDGYVELPLPFDFSYSGEPFRKIFIGTNGVASFHVPSSCRDGDCLPRFPRPIPFEVDQARAGPRSVVAPFWTDLTVDARYGAALRYVSTADAVVVEWARAVPYGASLDAGSVSPFHVSMSLTLRRDGELIVHYGPVVVGNPAGAGAPNATIGFTGPAGTEGAALVAAPGAVCTLEHQEGCCSASVRLAGDGGRPRACAATDLVSDLVFAIRTKPLPELEVVALDVSGMRQSEDGGFLIDYRATVANRGALVAPGVEWRAFLSRDQTLSSDDVLVDVGRVEAVEPGAESILTRGSVSTSAGPRARVHLVLVVNPLLRADGSLDFAAARLGAAGTPAREDAGDGTLGPATADGGEVADDSTDDGIDDSTWYARDVRGAVRTARAGALASERAVLEYRYDNNVRASEAFSNGLDLRAVSVGVVGPGTALVGERIEAEVQVASSGMAPTGPLTVDVELRLSRDRTADSSDVRLARHRVTVAGTNGVSARVPVVLPRELPLADYWLTARVDPDGTLGELSTLDNVAVSEGRLSVQRPELVAKRIELVDPATGVRLGLAPTSPVRLGEAIDVVLTVANTGTGVARDVGVVVALSADGSLSLLADWLLLERSLGDVGAGEERAVPLRVRLPESTPAGAPLKGGVYHVFAQLDPRQAVPEVATANNLASSGPRSCVAPAADLVLRAVEAPPATAAGELLPVFRSLLNAGNRSVPAAAYACYLSVNEIVTTQDVRLPPLDGSGERVVAAETVDLAAGYNDSRTQLFRVPASLEPGVYFVGCLLDPEGVVPEMSETNNALVSGPVRVDPGALRVITRSLPGAVVGRAYVARLVAAGVAGTGRWSIDAAGGPLPEGLVLTDTGVLQGTPLRADAGGARAVTVLVRDGASVAAARLALQVREATVPLVVTTTSLPVFSSGTAAPVAVQLGATGGHLPYTWRLVGGRLPAGFALSEEGVLEGLLGADDVAGAVPLGVEVRDASGSRARRELSLRIVQADGLAIEARSLPEARVGIPYAADVGVRRAAADAVDRPFAWRIDGALPPGLVLERQADVAGIVGRPTRAGVYGFVLEVEDARGRFDRRELAIIVRGASLRVTGALPEVVEARATVDVVLEAPGAEAPTFSLSHGRLPPGLVLTPSGRLFGTVADEGAVGTWPFAIQVRAADGAVGLRAFGVAVTAAPPAPSGCASVPGPAASALAGAVLAGLACFRRRVAGGRSTPPGRPSRGSRRRVRGTLGSLAPALALLALPGQARGQSAPSEGPGAYAVVRTDGQRFEPLLGGWLLDVGAKEGAQVGLPFALELYGERITSLVVSRHGYLSVPGSGGGEGVNQPIPHLNSLYPKRLIAPWWDELSSGTVRWAVRGTAPRRVAVFEWSGVAPVRSLDTRLSFQAQLFEATGQLRFAYAPGAPKESSASAGIMGGLGTGHPALECATDGRCDGSSYPAGAVIDFLRPPDFVVESVGLAAALTPGSSVTLVISVRNEGGRRSEGVPVRAVASADAFLDEGDPLVAEGLVPRVDPGETVMVRLRGRWPSVAAGVAAASAFAIAVVNPAGTVTELRTDNNVSTPVPVLERAAAPDLAVVSVEAGETAAPGGSVIVRARVANVGSAEASALEGTFYLSENPVVSPADRALGPRVSVVEGLAAGASVDLREEVLLPPELLPGPRWLGLCVSVSGDGASGLAEPSWRDNCATASRPFTLVEVAGLVITPVELPAAVRSGTYAVELSVARAGGAAVLSVVDGALPPGVTLSPSGALRGSPERAGDFTFTVRAERGEDRGTRTYTVRVAAGEAPLRIADGRLPSAEFGAPYRVDLSAVGGAPPYAWGLLDGALPDGLFLARDGRIEGRALRVAPATFTLRVVDTSGAVATVSAALSVVRPRRLLIAAGRSLPRATLGERYVQPLSAAGGSGPYRWLVKAARASAAQVPGRPSFAAAAAGETGAAGGDGGAGEAREELLLESLGLGVDPESGRLQGVPTRTGRFELVLAVRDAAGDEDVAAVTLVVAAAESLALETLALPDAVLTVPYSARLLARGAPREGAVRFELACVEAQGPDDGVRCDEAAGDRRLPEGLVLREGGVVEGTPAARVGVHAFWVRVTDASGRADVQPLAIRVRAAPAPSGCSAGGASTAAPWLALALAVRARRGRRASRGDVGAATRRGPKAVSLGLGHLFDARADLERCAGARAVGRRLQWAGVALSLAAAVACTGGGGRGRCEERTAPCLGGQVCDPEDGLCKCGGAGGIACGEGFTCDVAARTCVSERCRGVDCRSLPGTSCDVIAGRCACGGTAGSVCRADERCEPEEGRCVASGAAGGPCAEGEHRSLETGACRCGAGDACSATQRCRVGLDGVVACVEDACAGVRCAGGLSCDPADGLCACNGARCASGEACLCPGDAGTDSCPAEARACTPAGLCVGVDCGRDTLLTCDPSDGVCKCGGPGGTRCAVEQRCLLLPVPRCEGGDLCALADGGVRACRDGMSCDPEDGVCKCGGRGGSVCRDAARPVPGLVAGRSAEVCVTSGDRAQCREPCDPRLFAASSATCFEGAACFLDTTGVKAIAYCATSGELRPDGAACASPIACAQERGGLHQSLHCAGLGASSATGVCRAYCEVAAGPGGCDQSSGARVCVQVALAPRGLGTCQTP